MNRWLIRSVILTSTLALLLACQDQKPPHGQLTALLVHPGSLPAHRHQEALETLPREFLAGQGPNDRILIAQEPAADSEPDRDAPLYRELHLPDRPLQSYRQLRALHQWMNIREAGVDEQLEDTLLAIAQSLRNGQQEPACLYLVLNPDRLRAPDPETIDWRRPNSRPGGWTAFMLVPEHSGPHGNERAAWFAYLHALGAGRMQVRSLEQPLPPCRG